MATHATLPLDGAPEQPALTPNQEAAIPVLLAARSITDAARQLGISPRTIHYWFNDDGFAEAYREARHEQMDAASARLVDCRRGTITTQNTSSLHAI